MSNSYKEQEESLRLRRLVEEMIQKTEGRGKRERRRAPQYLLCHAGDYHRQIQQYWDDFPIEHKQWLLEEQPNLTKGKSLPLPKSHDPVKYKRELEEEVLAKERESEELEYDGVQPKPILEQRLTYIEPEMGKFESSREQMPWGMAWRDSTEELFDSVFYSSDPNLVLRKQRNQELFEIATEAIGQTARARSEVEDMQEELWIEKRKVKELVKLCAEEHTKYRGLLKSNEAIEASMEDEAL